MTDGGRPDGPGKVIRVLIADDEALFRQGLCALLADEPGIEVVAEAENGEDAVDRARALAPDVVLMDVRMPVAGGIKAVTRLLGELPTTKILMLTASDDPDDLYSAVRAGANGYLLKDVAIEEVTRAVRALVQGQSLISPAMASKLLSEFKALAEGSEAPPQLPAAVLTGRETEVLSLVARGMGNRGISEELGISESTVKNHVRNILEKLHLHSRMEAVGYAVRECLLDSPEGDRGAK